MNLKSMMFDYKMKEDLCKGPYYDKAIQVVGVLLAFWLLIELTTCPVRRLARK